MFFGVTDPAKIDHVLAILRGYADIPGVERLHAERNLKCDAWSNDVDIVLDITFPSRAALEAYRAHPIYRAGTAAIRPLRTIRIAADYESADASD